jgi:hypothetical protein
VPRYLTPYGFDLPQAPKGESASILGAWSGEYDLKNSRKRNICVAVVEEREHTIQVHSLWGSGTKNKLSMIRNYRDFIKYDGGSFEFKRGGYRMQLSRTDTPDTLDLKIVTRSGREFEATLRRGCRLHQ